MSTAGTAVRSNGELDRIAEALDRTPWARGLSWEQARAVAGYAERMEVDEGQVVVNEGEADASLFLVLSGSLQVVKRDSAGVKRVLVRIGRGSTFGEMALLDGEPRSASVVAHRPATLLRVSAAALKRMVAEKPRLGAEILWRLGRVVSHKLRRTSGALVDELG